MVSQGSWKMSQHTTGLKTEERVKAKLKRLGLEARKPVPDRGVDLEAWAPNDPTRVAKIQVKGRNPKKVKSFRWFQLRVSQAQIDRVTSRGLPVDFAWQNKLAKADFLVLDAVKTDETWVLPLARANDLIRQNEKVYGRRRGNIDGRQKEMNLDIVVEGEPLTERFSDCLGNFEPIRTFLNLPDGQ